MGYQKEMPSESQDRLLEGYTESTFSIQPNHRTGVMLKLWRIIVTSLAALAFLLVSISLLRGPSHSSLNAHDILPNTTWLSCGTTPESARAASCRFDVMMSAWIPEPCYDSELMENTLSIEKFSWFADTDFKKPVSYEQVRADGPHTQLFTISTARMYGWGRCVPGETAAGLMRIVGVLNIRCIAPRRGLMRNWTENNVVYYRCGRPWRDELIG